MAEFLATPVDTVAAIFVYAVNLLVFRIINALLVVMYFSRFAVPRNRNARASFYGFAFLVSFFIPYAVDFLSGRLILIGYLRTFTVVTTTIPWVILIQICAALALSQLFFKSDFSARVFLVVSFFAVREIGMILTTQVSHWAMMYLRMVLPLHQAASPEEYVLSSLLSTVLSMIIYILLFVFSVILPLRAIIKRFTGNITSRLELVYLAAPCAAILTMAIMYRLLASQGIITMAISQLPIINALIVPICIILLLCIVLSVRLFQKLVASYAVKREQAVLQSQLQQFQVQLHDMDEMYTEIKGMRHDMKSHLTNIRLLVNSGTPDKAELDNYLGKFEETLDLFDFVYQTGNSVSDIIIHQKYAEARHNGIDFSADFIYPGGMNIDAYDLAVILNNALENAIEACCRMESTNRFIKLFAYVRGEMFFIEVENSFNNESENAIRIDSKTKLPVTSKTEVGLHGIGMGNMKRCAAKYFGDIDFQTNEEKFRLTVMLQGQRPCPQRSEEAEAGFIPAVAAGLGAEPHSKGGLGENIN